MRIEQYTEEQIDLAYDTMEIKYYEEPKSKDSFGRMMLQELVFYNDYMLYHLSDNANEDDVIYPCSQFWYEDISTYEFDCDNSVLTIEFINAHGNIQIFANPTQLENIYRIITTMDEKFVVTEFEELNDFFKEILENR